MVPSAMRSRWVICSRFSWPRVARVDSSATVAMLSKASRLAAMMMNSLVLTRMMFAFRRWMCNFGL